MKYEKKSFHEKRSFRIDDETYEWMKKEKKGTWNYFFRNIKKRYDKERVLGRSYTEAVREK